MREMHNVNLALGNTGGAGPRGDPFPSVDIETEGQEGLLAADVSCRREHGVTEQTLKRKETEIIYKNR